MKDIIRVLKVLDDNELLNQASIGFYQRITYDQQPNYKIRYCDRQGFQIKCLETVPTQKFQKTKQQLDKLGIQSQIDFRKNLKESDFSNKPVSMKSVVPFVTKYSNCVKKFSQQSLKSNFEKAKLFLAQLIGGFQINLDKDRQIIFKLQIKASQEDDQYIEKFKNLFKDDSEFITQFIVIQYIAIPPINNAQCTDCKLKLKFPFYWCKWDLNPNTFRCRQCVQNKQKHKQKNPCYYQNNILLYRDNVKINLNKFGKNQKQEKSCIFKAHPTLTCTTCKLPLQQNDDTRYMCLGCYQYRHEQDGIVHVCQRCFDKFQKKDQRTLLQLHMSNHASYHPWLRIPIQQ